MLRKILALVFVGFFLVFFFLPFINKEFPFILINLYLSSVHMKVKFCR